MAGALEPMEHRASCLRYDVDGDPAYNTDMAGGQLITKDTLAMICCLPMFQGCGRHRTKDGGAHMPFASSGATVSFLL